MSPVPSVLRHADFRLLLAGRFASALGGQMLTFAVTWELWIRTQSAFSLGLVGLAEVVPILLFALPAGVLADRRNRRTILLTAQTLGTSAAAGLLALSLAQGPVPLVYLCLALLGLARAFSDPAASAYTPLVVPASELTQASTWGSGAFQIAVIGGPALAGGLVAWWGGGVSGVYALAAGLLGAQVVLVALIKARPALHPRTEPAWQSLVGGLRYLRGQPILLGAITLDLFAVLLGGAVALLPIYATDILKVGPQGLGLLRAAPAAGALAMALVLTRWGRFTRSGPLLLGCVAGFGMATIVFGFSTSFVLSLAMLAVLGALDNVSVVIRSTLFLTQVPDAMRGRLAAVNTVFIASSNELGDFESGLVAGLIGPVAAVVAGGLGTLLVVLLVWRAFPALARLRTLDAPRSP